MTGTSTPLLQLYKPDRLDFVNVLTDINDNMDKIDSYAVAAQANVRTVGGNRYVTGGIRGTSTGAVALCGISTGSVILTAGRSYEVAFSFNYSTTLNGDEWLFQVRTTNLTGAIQLQYVTDPKSQGNPFFSNMSFIHEPSVTGAVVFIASMSRISGTGNCSTSASSNGATYTKITDVGPASIIVDV